MKYLEKKLDVFNLAYIRHSVELELTPRRRGSVSSQTTRDWSWWWKPTPSNNQRSSTNGDFSTEDVIEQK